MKSIRSTDDVYATFGRMLQELAASEGFAPRLRQMDQTIRFDLSEPDATVVATFLRNQPLSVDFGGSNAPVDTTVRMPSEKANALLLGTINIFAAIDSGAVAVDGEVRNFLAVLPQVAEAVAPLYRAMLDPPERSIGTEEITGPMALCRGAEGDVSSDGTGLQAT